MAIPVWQREKTWIGATERMNKAFEGYGRKVLRAKPPATLEAFLSSPEWVGSEVFYPSPGVAEVRHPSGARAYLQTAAFAEAA